jgi:ATP-dependent DNA helicase DinG
MTVSSLMSTELDYSNDLKEALSILDKDGVLSRYLKGYEPREQQRRMLLAISQAYHKNEIALIEAGTGIGKSMAYLIPAVLWALKHKERTVISTHTINLQEQLIEKDIPLLLKAINADVKAVLVKGMGNYICLRKLEDIKYEFRLQAPKEVEELEKIEAWSQTTRDGSRSSLPMVPSASTWEQIRAEYDTCNHRDCKYFKECFYFKARKQAETAQILVVNHHLLCFDLIKREKDSARENSGILPDYSHVILDEAHHIEDIATDFFAHQANQMEVMRNLHRFSSEKQGKGVGKLPLLRQSLLNAYKKDPPPDVMAILKKLTTDLPALRWEVWYDVQAAFEAFARFTNLLNKPNATPEDFSSTDVKLRLLALHQTHPEWQNQILPKTKKAIEAIDKFLQSLVGIEKDIGSLKNERLNEMAKNILFDVNALSGRLSDVSVVLKGYLDPKIPLEKVRWIEVQSQQRGQNIRITDAELDVSKLLSNHLFNKFKSVILCSATLTTNHQFDFIRKRLGLVAGLIEEMRVTENTYDSPFDYQKQALLVIPTDIPHPLHPDFFEAAIDHIWQAVRASHGNAFVLFTSYSMLANCYKKLSKRLVENKYYPLKQGESNRQTLLNKFKKVERSVLFGTDSFWEGVDVAGDALRCVIIVKLPFKVPSEPIIQARSEAIAALGGDPFFDYALPHAIVKFKQGFGRLIRNRRDRGCIVCLDNRILTKGYGKLFLKSLPNCQQLFDKKDCIYKSMEDFYRKTYHFIL